MPTYEYRCPEGHDSEDFVLKISAAKSEIPCPRCGATAARRVSAGAGLVFKGSGFYITDYGKDGKKDQQKPTAAKSGSGEAGATPAAASAPAASSAAASGGSSASATASAPATPAKSDSPKRDSAKKESPKSSGGSSSGSSSSGST